MREREVIINQRTKNVAFGFVAVFLLAAVMMVLGSAQAFAATSYTISTSVTNGSITGDKVVTEGDDWTVQYSPDDGYRMSYVEVDNKRVEAPTFYRFDNITANHTVKVVYEKIPEYNIVTYVTHGSITEGGKVLEGGDYTVTYQADKDYRLARVEVDGQEVKNPNTYTFTNIKDNHTISVTYEKIPSYNIYTYVTNGTITQNGLVQEGDDYEVIYEPYKGYRLASVKVDGATVTNTHVYKFTNVTGAHVISVVYEKIPQYEIKTSVTNGTITENGLVEEGADYEVIYEPKPGYKLGSVKVDGTEVGNLHTYKFLNVKENHTISVEYVKVAQYEIKTSVTNGTITQSSVVNEGDDFEVVYEAKSGYKLASVKVDGAEIENPHVYKFINVNENHTISVVYEKVAQYEIRTSVTNGTITQSSTVNEGDDFEVVYEPKDGYRIASVKVDGAEVENPHVYKFINIQKDHNISVEYIKISQYRINTEVTNGTITGNGTVEEGEDYDVFYNPKEGYKLGSVKVDGAEVNYPNAYKFTKIKEDHTIKVEYVKIAQYKISTEVTNGTITENGTVNEGEDYKVTYNPKEGYRLASVKVDGNEVNYPNSYTFTKIKEDHTIKVEYEKIPKYKISTEVTNGTITENGNIDEGGDYEVVYYPKEGYRLASVKVDGTEINYPNSYKFTNIREDHTIKVEYVKLTEYKISTEVTNGTITASGIVNEGDDFDVFYNPKDGYRLASVKVDGAEVNYPNGYKFSRIKEDHTIKVEYVKINEYKISTEVTNGTITESGVVQEGDEYEVVYNPKEGYRLASVKVDGTEVNYPSGYKFTRIKADHTIKVTYEKIPQFTIYTDVTNGTITENGSVEEGGSYEVTYNPFPGYILDHVKVDGNLVNSPFSYKFTNITKNHLIQVVYRQIPQYTILTEVENGKITDSGVVWGGDYDVSYYPNEDCRLVSVKVDGNEVYNAPNSYKFQNIVGSHTIKVVYEKIPKYNIYTSVKNGKISDDGQVLEGGDYTVSYKPNDGYKLDYVEVDGKELAAAETSHEESYTFKDITRDHAIRVQYTEIPTYAINTEVEHGTITDSGLVREGGKYKVNYSPDKNCRLAYIEVDGKKVEAPYGYEFENIQENHSIRVVYEEIPRYTITTEVENGTISETGTVLEGGSYDVLYNPSEGYQLCSVTVDGETVKAPHEYKFREITGNHTIKVVYEKTPKIAITEVAERNVYNAGDTIKFIVTVQQTQKGAEARNVVVTNKLWDGLTMVKDSFRGEGLEVVSQGYNSYEVNIPSVKDTYTFTYEAVTEKAVDSNSLQNVVTAIADNVADSVSATKTVSALTPKPVISQKVSKNTPSYMDELTYTIVVEEPQDGVSVRNAVVTNMIPSGLSVVKSSIKTTGDAAKAVLSDNILEVNIPDLSEKTTITFNAKVTGKQGNVDNVAVLTGTDIGTLDASTRIYIHKSFLHLKATKAKKKSIYLTFNRVLGAKKYVIYGNICDHNGKVYPMKKIKTVKATGYDNYKVLKNIRTKKLKAGTFYKMYVVAYDANGKKITTSNSIHEVTKGGKYKNSTGVKTNKKSLKLKVGETDKIRAAAKGSKVKYHVSPIRYRSNNTSVATVTSGGKVTAKRAGTCKIYVYAQNGTYKAVSVRVSK